MYQPELGRFLQPDPMEFAAGDFNLYRYCHNDPVNKSDPFGLVPPAEGLMDLPRKTVQEIKEAMKENIRRTQAEQSPDGPGGKPRYQEQRTMNYDNGKGERKNSTETGTTRMGYTQGRRSRRIHLRINLRLQFGIVTRISPAQENPMHLPT